MWQVESWAPLRIDMAGGTLDLWPLHQVYAPAATVNMAVDLYAKIRVRLARKQEKAPANFYLQKIASHFWKGADLIIEGETPLASGSGMGGSSALGVALIEALKQAAYLCGGKISISQEATVALLRDLEAQILGIPTGVQDHWAALRGGLNILTYPCGKDAEVETYSPFQLKGLNPGLIVAHTGISRNSAVPNLALYERAFRLESKKTWEGLAETSVNCAQALRSNNLEKFLHHSQEDWSWRQQLHPGVASGLPQGQGEDAAAPWGGLGRVCGAGGGGALWFWLPEHNKKLFIDFLETQGHVSVVACQPQLGGVKIFIKEGEKDYVARDNF